MVCWLPCSSGFCWDYSVEFLERQTGIGHSSFSSGVSSFGLELIFETIIPVQVTTTTQRYIPIRENPLIIKDRLGHEDIETTLGTYGHLYPNSNFEVAMIVYPPGN